jgi:hypothetical protein
MKVARTESWMMDQRSAATSTSPEQRTTQDSGIGLELEQRDMSAKSKDCDGRRFG